MTILRLQADTSSIANDGFMLNFLGIMLHLSSKVQLDKISAKYVFHPDSRLKIADETRLKFDSKEVATFASEMCKRHARAQCG